jgi:4-amino-4-deoxy-L-arabinose transferase-like glycosyltransferase
MLAAWVAAVLPHEPDFLRYAVVEETLLRVASSEHFHRGGPPDYYLKTIPWALGIWILPLVVLAPTLVRIARQGGRDGTAVGLAARAAAVIVVFFTLSASKRPQYVLPALAPLSLLVAIGMAARPSLTARMFAVAGGLCVVVGCGALVASRPGLMPTRPDIALPVMEIVRVAGLVLLPLGAAMACGGRRAGWAIPAAAALAPCLVLALLPPLAIYAERRSARQIAASIPADSPVVCFDVFRPSLPFYLNRTVTVLSDGGSALTSNYVVSQRARLREPTLGFKRSLPDVLTANPGAHVVIGAGQLGRLKRFAPDHRFEEVAGDTRSTILRAVAGNRAERSVLDGATGSVANGQTR